MDRLRLSYRELSTYSLAAQQNAYRLFVNARLHYLEDEGEEEVESPTLRNLTVKLECPVCQPDPIHTLFGIT